MTATTTSHRSGVAPGWARQDTDAGAWYAPTAPPQPQQTALARPVDVQALAAAGIDANSRMVADLLRSFAPTIDAEPQYSQAPAGLSSRDELDARNQRFRWTISATVALATVTAAGIVTLAYLAGHVSGPAAAAAWLTLSGLAGYASVNYVHTKEANLTPEAIARIDADAGAYASERRADAQTILAEAFADAIRDDAAARRQAQENARAANALLVAEPPAPRREMDYTPATRPAPMLTYATTAPRPQEAPAVPPVAQTPTPAASTTPRPASAVQEPDPGLAAMLAAIDELYRSAEDRQSDTITLPLPWAARARGWAERDKQRAAAALAYFDPPLISRSADNGGRYTLNRQWRRPVARGIIARQWAI